MPHGLGAATARLSQYSALPAFYRLAGRLVPSFAVAALLLGATALAFELVLLSDGPNTESVGILLVHRPAAWLSAFLYVILSVWAGATLLSRSPLPAMLACGVAPTGALMSFVALWAGSMWGRPVLGTWWICDATQICGATLLGLFLAFLGLHAAIEDPRRADRAAARLALAGAALVPLLYLALDWWDPLPTPGLAFPAMTATAIVGAALMTAALWTYSVAVSLARARSIILERERDELWAAQAIAAGR